MAIFKRKTTDKDTLPEVEQYYSAERRERAGLAWLLALVSIIIVALIIIGLFFGGRWIWRTLNKNDKSGTVTTSEDEGSVSVDGGPSEPTKPTEPSKPAENSSDSNSGSSSSNSTTPKTDSSSTPAPSASTEGTLANTGPGDVAAVFAATATTAAAGHYLVSKRRADKR